MQQTKYDQYIFDVENDKIIVCELVKLTIKRHQNDLKRTDIYFDRVAAQNAIEWIETLCIGKDYSEDPDTGEIIETPQQLILTNWQAFVVAMIFGWKWKATKRRRFTSSYKEMAKKSGKTTLEAAIALLFLHLQHKAEVYACATKKEQARIAFKTASYIVKETPWMRGHCEAYEHSIVIPSEYASFVATSSDSKKQDGLKPFYVLIDELHEHKNGDLYGNMKSALVFQPEGHIGAITTSGFNKNSFCYKLRKICVDVLNGVIEDDSLFVMIFTQDENDREDDYTTWVKSNPNVNVTVPLENLIRDYHSAKNAGGQDMVNFLTKNLNRWCDADKVWVPDAIWILNTNPEITLADLHGKVAYGGLDCAKSNDLNAYAHIFPDHFEIKGKMIVPIKAMFWMPDNKLKTPDHIDYSKWVKAGFIKVAPDSNISDYSMIEEDILREIEKYDFQGYDYDHAYAGNIASNHAGMHGLQVTPLGQGFLSLTGPTTEFERMALGGLFEHFKNPVLRWMMGNAIIKRHRTGLVMIDKEKAKNRVDGISATINAIARWKRLGNQNQGAEIIWI